MLIYKSMVWVETELKSINFETGYQNIIEIPKIVITYLQNLQRISNPY